MARPGSVPTPLWYPTTDVVGSSNLSALMQAQGFATFDDLHTWSISEIDEFWAAVIKHLDIQFVDPPSAIRASADPMEPQWLVDAIFNIVSSCLDHNDEAVAIISGGQGSFETVTVGELSRLVARFAAGFARAGIVEGDAVAIVMPMNKEAVVSYLGIIAAGGVVVSIADSFAPDEIATRLEISGAVAVVTQAEAVRMGRSLPMYTKCVEAGAARCVVVGATNLRAEDIAWDEFLVDDADLDPIPMPASAHTNILFSSGTTGDPKAIPWDQTTPIKAAMDGRYHHDIHEGDVVAWPTNLGWMMGPWLIYASLLNGAAMALYDDAPTSRGFVEFVEEAGVTMLGVVPSIVAAWRGSGVLQPGDWSTVRVLSSTGEASNADDCAWLSDAAGCLPLIEYCGGTEIGGAYVASTVLHPSIPAHFTTPTLGLDLVLIDDDGAVGDSGEVFLVPPSMGLSTELLNMDHAVVYFDGVPEIGRPLRRHGDRMERIAGGYLRALGRVDDTMNLGGVKVSSADLEAAIGDVDGVAEVAAVAVPPAGGGPERLIVFAVPSGDATNADGLDAEAVRSAMQQSIRSRLNPLFKVHEVVLIDALPRTASNKVMRRTLRSAYGE